MKFLQALGQGLGSSRIFSMGVRQRLLRWSGLKRLRDSFVSPEVFFESPSQVTGPAGAFLNTRCFVEQGPVAIGRNVFIGPGTMILCQDREIGTAEERAGHGVPRETTVEDGCWIGAGAIIMPGVTVGRGCVVAAGAVVEQSCPPNGLYAGTPAKRIRELNLVEGGL